VSRPELDPSPLFELLIRHGVDFVVIGGVAAAALGSARATFDVDSSYSRDAENLAHLAEALREAEATLRGAPSDVPFLLDAETLADPRVHRAHRIGRPSDRYEGSCRPAARQGGRARVANALGRAAALSGLRRCARALAEREDAEAAVERFAIAFDARLP
jgi:hypothetical protein